MDIKELDCMAGIDAMQADRQWIARKDGGAWYWGGTKQQAIRNANFAHLEEQDNGNTVQKQAERKGAGAGGYSLAHSCADDWRR
jgi:hypothetical protein